MNESLNPFERIESKLDAQNEALKRLVIFLEQQNKCNVQLIDNISQLIDSMSQLSQAFALYMKLRKDIEAKDNPL